MDQPQKQVKPFLEYEELVGQLKSRGMLIDDEPRALRKIAQVGYYRLSGYWHSARRFQQKEDRSRVYLNEFREGTRFSSVFDFYLFDKKMRILLLDALERIEVYFRTVIAHELGRDDPLCYLRPKTFSKDAFVDDERSRKVPSYKEWIARHQKRISESQEDSIVAHRDEEKPIPIWVAAEVWDFGALSKFYSMLSGANQDLICNRIGISERNVVDNWLINMNVLRNRCAHHSRVCNRPNPRGLKIPQKGYFNDLQLDAHAREKLFGLIAVCWYLLKKIGPGSDWIRRISDLIDSIPTVPGFNLLSMGIRTASFPRGLFPEAAIVVKMVAPVAKDFSALSSEALDLAQEATKYLESNLTEVGAIDRAKVFTDALLDCAQDVESILGENAK